MFLLNHKTTNLDLPQWIFTSHYVPIKSTFPLTKEMLSASFTSHYVPIKSKNLLD